MRKFTALSFVVAILLGIVFVSTPQVSAQDGGAIEYDTWVEGEITNDEFEHTYVFEGTAGDLIQIEMYRKPGTFGLFPEVALLDPTGSDLARDAGFLESGALIVRRLAFDGEYTVSATRPNGAEGSSEGEYIVRVKSVEPISAGDTVEAPLSQDDEVDVTDVFIMVPEEDVSWTVAFGYDAEDLYPDIALKSWTGEDFDDEDVFEIDGEGYFAAAIATELKADTIYVLYVQNSWHSKFGEDETIVEISILETE